MKKILLLSAYDAASHQYWRKTLEEKLDQFEWTQLALPDRHFYWRARGNSLSFAFQHREILEQDYDLLIATSMVDLSSLRGFCPSLAKLPTIVYFHENQFAYPVNDKQPNLVNVQVTSIYNALCADKVLFNSAFNKMTFLDGAEKLLKRLPDLVPKGLVEAITSRSEVIPVPINVDKPSSKVLVQSNVALNKIPEIVWNHRWEYDKQPEVFFDALTKLKQENIAFKLHILGQSFRNQPECFENAKQLFKDEIETYGFQEKHTYLEILSKADFVVSTALHDFQGLSLQEAITLGCTPIAPNRVAYPEYIPESCLYNLADNPTEEAQNLCTKIKYILLSKYRIRCELAEYSCAEIIPKYQQIIDGIL